MQIRQGDVLLQSIRRRKTYGEPSQGRVILAHGEATGHVHEVVGAAEGTALPPAQLFDAPDGTRYLLVDAPCVLIHQEHAALALAPGAYRVIRQREYSPEAIRLVAD